MKKNKNKILIISTDIILSDSVVDIIRSISNSYDVIITGFSNFERKINQKNIDLILVDLTNSTEGFDLVLKNEYIKIYNTPILAIIDDSDENSIINTYKEEITDYICKNHLSRLKIAIPRDIKISRLYKENSIIISEIEKENPLIYKLNDITNNLEDIGVKFDISSIFERIFHSFPIGISLVNAESGNIININQAYLEIIEFKKVEVLGKNASSLNIWKHVGERETIINFITKFGSIKNKEETFLTKTGEEKNVLLSAIYLPNVVPAHSMFLFITIDISDRKKMEEDAILSLEKEKNLNILKTRFISMISHEFRTPLTTIMLSTDLLRTYGQNWDQPDKEKHYSRIQSTILSLIQLLENVIIISRIDTNEFEVHLEDLDVKSFFESLIESVLVNINSKSKFNFQAEGDFKNIMIDENLTSLMMNNILTNAIKYSEEGSIMEFSILADKKNKRLVLTVKDYGIGIPEEEIHNVVESFYRAANVGNKSGFGLGLTIVKKCIDKLEGKLKIESELNKFTTITIILPLIEYKKQVF